MKERAVRIKYEKSEEGSVRMAPGIADYPASVPMASGR